jgi:alginate O-acetyltransferase complex protein AlgI
MVFSSKLFLMWFLPFVLLMYYIVPRKAKNWVLLFASLAFYAEGEKFFTIVMLGSIAMNYVFGLWVHRRKQKELGLRLPLTISVACNLAVLAVFKYANFVVENINVAFAQLGWSPIEVTNIPLPIGISFFTFQAMSYVIDVARGDGEVQKRPDHLGLYISMFPQLIAGPIVRYRDVAEQIHTRQETRNGFVEGIRRFVIGLGKKTIIADTMARIVDSVFDVPMTSMSVDVAWLVMICYALQIYFDFSAYSDMAIGLGRMFGFKFLENFNYPYISSSITEFWRRWHISLSSWFRDYLYIPLGGNRVAKWKTYRNLVLVFFLCGLWHGASWNFVIWGMFHGSLLVVERLVRGRIPGILKPLGHLYVICAVLVGWVFFRAVTFAEGAQIVQAMFGFGAAMNGKIMALSYLDNWTTLILFAALLGATPIIPYLSELAERLAEQRKTRVAGCSLRAAGWFALYPTFMLVIALLCAGSYNTFIYFRF